MTSTLKTGERPVNKFLPRSAPRAITLPSMADADDVLGWSEEAGERVKTLRNAKRWTQDELAAAVAVKSGQISKIERGERPPSKKRLRMIAEELATTPEYILSGDEAARIPTDPWERARVLPEYQRLPQWAREEWHARTEAQHRSRDTDSVKFSKLVVELVAVLSEFESGKLTEESMAKAPPSVAPTAPPAEDEPPPRKRKK